MMPIDQGDVPQKLRKINEARAKMPLGQQHKLAPALIGRISLYVDMCTLEHCIEAVMADFDQVCECGRPEKEHANHGNWCPIQGEDHLLNGFSTANRFRAAKSAEVPA